MTNRRWCFPVLLVTILFVCFGGAGPSQAAKEEPLRVLTIHPSGEIDRVKQITITFNQPMVPLGEMDRAPEEAPVSLEPTLEGRYRWLNVYTLAYELETPLEGSFSGRITVKKKTKALSGASLPKDVQATFTLPLIKPTRISPKPKTAGLALRPQIRLSFNQALDLEQLQRLAYFRTVDGQRVLCLVRADEKANSRRRPGGAWTVIITPERDLPPDTAFDLVAPPGLASASGPLLSDSEFHWTYQTYGPLGVKEIVGYRPRAGAPFDPESGLQIQFTNPVSPREVMRHLEVSPKYDLTQVEGADDKEAEPVTSLWLPSPFQAASLYTFTFGAGIKDVFGQPLKGRTNFQVTMGPARPVLELPGRQGVLESATDPSYPFRVRNISRVNVRGYFLRPDKVIPFIIKHRLYRYLSESTQDLLADLPPYEIKTSRMEISVPPNTMNYQPVRLKKIFGSDVGQGLLYFDLNAPETNHPKDGRPMYRRALVQVTDIGLSVKFGRTNTLIWTTDLGTGRPLAKVRLEIRNLQNHVLWRGESDKQGLAMAPGAGQLKIVRRNKRYGEPFLFVLARHREQFSFVSTQWRQGIQPWNFNLDSRDLEEGEDVMTWVLTALPLYKPGDEVRFKIIQRLSETEDLRPPKYEKILAHVKDSRGKTIEKFKLKMTSFGTASGRFTLPVHAPLGGYSIAVGPTESEMSQSGFFRVEAYRKPTFSVEIKPSVKTALVGEKISVGLKATYHFGSPVVNRPAEYTVTAGPTGFSLPRFEDYTIIDRFSGPEKDDEQIPTVAAARLSLDNQGRAGLDFKAIPASRPQPRTFEIEATVTDVDRRAVSRRSSILVHPASFYLGLKAERYVVGPGEKMAVALIAATPEGRLIPNVTTNLVLYRRTWQTVRRKGVGGYYHYISKPTDTVVERVRTKTLDRPLSLDFTIDKGGFYYVAAGTKDRSGRSLASSVGFYAYGGDSAGWERYDHDRIDLVPDKKDYRPGETATILIKSPFSQATGLLTIERGGVRRYQVFNVTSPSPVVRVKIQESDSPNIFVSVLLVRGRISDKLDRQGRDPGKPAFKAGYIRLLVKDESSRLKVEVVPDRPQARPGEEVELTVKVSDASGRGLKTEVALVVADAALLQLASENIYFPERLFFAPRSLAVWTTDLRLNLIGRRHYGLKGANMGGGGLGSATDRYRRRFISLAFFEPHLVTDGSGLAKVKFKLPGNLTTFKIFAVANDNGQKFGTGISSLRVTKPLVIKPGLPNFGGVGDKFAASIVVHNRSDIAGQATITLSGDNFDLLEPGPRLVNLEAKSSREVGFPVRILSASKAVFRFAAALGPEWDAAEFGLPLRFPNSLVTSATFGRLKKSSRESVLVPENADPERGFLTLNVSASLIGALNDAFDYLRAYPHQCLEQKTSQVLGALLYLEWRPRLGGLESAKSRAEKRIEKYLEGLPAFQGFDGGFSFWPETRRTDPYLSAYVVQVLNIARNSGLPVDEKMFNKSLSYLVRVLNHNRWPQWYEEKERLTARVYLIAVLAESGRPVAPLVENLYENRKKLSSFELALLLETLSLSGRDEQVARQLKDIKRRLFGRAVITPREVHFEEKYGPRGLMASRARTNAVILKALLKADPGNPHLVSLARWLVRSRRDGHWGSTQNNGLVLLALTEYVKVMEETPPEFSFQAVLDLQPLAQADFTGFEAPPLEREVPLRDLKKGTKIPLELNLEGKGSAYYTLRLNYAPQEPDLEPRRAGFAVSRTYTRVKGPGGEAVAGRSFGRGDLVRVDLTLLVPSQRHWVVLEDLVPAGLEPINFNLPTVSKHLQALLDKGRKPEQYYRRYWYQHREIRHDRVVIYARVLTEGAYNFSYLCRAVTPGDFIAPGPRVEEMYSPEVSGRGRGRRFEIETGE